MACRVELRDLPFNASWQEREIAFKKMFTVFKKQVAEAGIIHELKQREHYESPGEIKRRQKKEADNQRLKAKLRENFPQKKKDKDKDKDSKGFKRGPQQYEQ
jgi:ribosomal protein S21